MGDPAHGALTAVRDLPWSAWVTIQTGCDNSCAFCIVPSVRGREVSRPIEELVDEVSRSHSAVSPRSRFSGRT